MAVLSAALLAFGFLVLTRERPALCVREGVLQDCSKVAVRNRTEAIALSSDPTIPAELRWRPIPEPEGVGPTGWVAGGGGGGGPSFWEEQHQDAVAIEKRRLYLKRITIFRPGAELPDGTTAGEETRITRWFVWPDP